MCLLSRSSPSGTGQAGPPGGGRSPGSDSTDSSLPQPSRASPGKAFLDYRGEAIRMEEMKSKLEEMARRISDILVHL